MTHYDDHEHDASGRIDVALWKRILVHAKPFRHLLGGMVVAGITLAFSDALLPWITGQVIDEAATNGVTARLGRLSIVYVLLVSIIAADVWIFIRLAGRIATGFAHDIRQAAFDHLQVLSFSFYDHKPVGWLMARMTSDASRLSNVIPWTLLDAVWGSSLLLSISVMMLFLHWKLALPVMLIVPPLAIVSSIFQRKLLRTQREVRKTNSMITASFNENIMGVRTTKSLVREGENLREFQRLSTRMYDHSVRNGLLAAAYLPLVLTIGSAGVGMALARGGVEVVMGMSLGTLVAFMQYAALFYMPIGEIAERFTQLQEAQASAERLQGLLDTKPGVFDSEDVIEASRRADPSERITSIDFEDVTFAYNEGETVLSSFSLSVSEGETIALVGATGSGKSTIVSLLCRFYEPTAGLIRINGTDYRARGLEWLQSRLGIVLQAPHLFSGTIADNIRYGRLDASRADIEAAARMVNAHEFIMAMDEGYETSVGEGGGRLSTGQKQLISLARAVLANPQIFVLDEATSSVDTETERLIQSGIERVLEGRISFIIAHRLSTIRSADRILVIDKGKLVESGNHGELLALRGRYFALYTNQFAREQETMALKTITPLPSPNA